MKFFKENSYDVVRLFINQIGIAIFSMIIYTAVGMVSPTTDAEVMASTTTKTDNSVSSPNLGAYIGISIFAMIFYFSLLYTVTWELGAKDKIRIDGGRLDRKTIRNKGTKLALLANIPNFILSFISALTWGLYLLGVEAMQGVALIFNIITRLLMSMYLGVLQGAFSFVPDEPEHLGEFWQSIGYFVIPILAIAVTQIGYLFGLHERKIFSSKANKKS